MKKFALVALVLATTALSASAALTTEFVLNTTPSGTIPVNPDGSRTLGGTNYFTYDMMVTSLVFWTNARLDITLATGEFYNDVGFGKDTQPGEAVFGFVPEVEWDTYARTPGGELALASFTVGAQYGQNSLTPDPPAGNTIIAASWFWIGNAGPGIDNIARLTLSADANGTITGMVFDANPGFPFPTQNSFDGVYSIVDGHIVPEPATLSLLGIGVVGLMRRRRR